MNSATGFIRRRFLMATSCIASAMALPVMARATNGHNAGLMAADFRRALNSEFSATALSNPSSRVSTLTLTDVSAARHPHPSLDKSSAHEFAFSLKFGVHAKGLLQDTYLLSHPSLGNFAALLVPTGDGNSLRAEFHRL